MITGGDLTVGQEALRLGAYRFILKPINYTEIVFLLSYIDEIRQQERKQSEEHQRNNAKSWDTVQFSSSTPIRYYSCFIGYSSGDQDFVQHIYNSLTSPACVAGLLLRT